MPKEFVDRLNGILNYYEIDRGIAEDLKTLLDDAYFQGWSDAKDDSKEEAYLLDDGNWVED